MKSISHSVYYHIRQLIVVEVCRCIWDRAWVELRIPVRRQVFDGIARMVRDEISSK